MLAAVVSCGRTNELPLPAAGVRFGLDTRGVLRAAAFQKHDGERLHKLTNAHVWALKAIAPEWAQRLGLHPNEVLRGPVSVSYAARSMYLSSIAPNKCGFLS